MVKTTDAMGISYCVQYADTRDFRQEKFEPRVRVQMEAFEVGAIYFIVDAHVGSFGHSD